MRTKVVDYIERAIEESKDGVEDLQNGRPLNGNQVRPCSLELTFS